MPTFWSSSRDDFYERPGLVLPHAVYGELIVAILFGAIHSAAWNTVFPSKPEMMLWRISAVIIAGIPAFLLFILPINCCIGEGPFNILLLTSAAVYAVARAILLVVPLISLREVPYSALVDVDWGVYIPHV